MSFDYFGLLDQFGALQSLVLINELLDVLQLIQFAVNGVLLVGLESVQVLKLRLESLDLIRLLGLDSLMLINFFLHFGHLPLLKSLALPKSVDLVSEIDVLKPQFLINILLSFKSLLEGFILNF